MNRRYRNLAMAAIAAGVIIFLAVDILSSIGSPAQPERAPSRRVRLQRAPRPTSPAVPAESGTSQGPLGELETRDEGADFRTYAVEVQELPGLPLDSEPGTRLQVWVTWQPPLVEKPKLQLLVGEAYLERIAPPLLPNGPYAALLLVEREKIPDLMYGDQLGRLSATVLP